MPKCDFNKVSSNLLKLHFGMGVLLQICCIFSQHLFLGTPLKSCFCKVLSSTYLQMFKLLAIMKISLIKVLKRRGRRIEPYLKVVVISRQLLISFPALHLENLFVNKL